MAAPGSDAPVFVVGHPRSGTTLLRLILNAHPRIVIPPEGHVVSFLRRCEQKYGPMSDDDAFERAIDRLAHKDRQKEWGFTPDQIIDVCLQGEHSPAGIFASLMSLWTEQSGKPRWGEKTPGNYRYIEDVTGWFPKAQVVHIVRDARDVAVSCLTPPFSDRYDKGNEYEVALRWRDAVHRGRRAAQALGPQRYTEFRYEDLTAEPERLVHALCDFLHEDFVPEMMDFHRGAQGKLSRGEQSFHKRTHGEVDRKRVERWRRDVPREFVMRVEGMAGKELAELGYELSGFEPTLGLRAEFLAQKLKPRKLTRTFKPKGGGSSDKQSRSASGTGGPDAGGPDAAVAPDDAQAD